MSIVVRISNELYSELEPMEDIIPCKNSLDIACEERNMEIIDKLAKNKEYFTQNYTAAFSHILDIDVLTLILHYVYLYELQVPKNAIESLIYKNQMDMVQLILNQHSPTNLSYYVAENFSSSSLEFLLNRGYVPAYVSRQASTDIYKTLSKYINNPNVLQLLIDCPYSFVQICPFIDPAVLRLNEKQYTHVMYMNIPEEFKVRIPHDHLPAQNIVYFRKKKEENPVFVCLRKLYQIFSSCNIVK